MSTTVEKISSNKVKLSFDIDAAKFDEAMGKAYIKVRGQVAIPGFRKGHAPRKMIENMYGEGVFYDEAFELIFDEVYGPAIDENKLEVVDRPQVDIQQIGAGKNLQFTCEVFVKPDVTLGEYKGVEVKREHTLVTEDEVNAEIEKERNKQAAEVAVDDRPVAEGDTVNLDYSGSVDGVKFAGGTAEAQTLKIGSHTFIPGFEEQMVGMNIGEEKDLNVTFPTEYHAKELAGKEAVFHVKVNGITETQLPALDAVGEDDAAGLVAPGGSGHPAQRAFRLQRRGGLQSELGPQRPGLLVEIGGEVAARDMAGARPVFDVGCGGRLTAQNSALQQQGGKAGPFGVQCRRQAGRSSSRTDFPARRA